jgi:hypothetical protein
MPAIPAPSADAIRAKIAAGALPAGPFDKTWYGRGRGTATCAVCELVITTNHVEVEGDIGEVASALRFHADCLDAWARVCREPELGA